MGNIQMRTEYLKDKGISFESKNNGQHLVVHSLLGTIDYWPSTNKWKVRDTGESGHGAIELAHYTQQGNHPNVVIEECVVYEHADAVTMAARITELEDLLFQAFTLRTNWKAELTTKVSKALSKAKAHNSTLPWD